MNDSDLFRVFVEKKNGNMIIANPDIGLYKYNNSNVQMDDVVEIQLPYSMKLFIQQMQALGTDIKMKTC